jgi:hypothetical protein
MPRLCLIVLCLTILTASTVLGQAPQLFRLPDINTLKHLTTRYSEHAPDIAGKETVMDFYSGPNGTMVTIYSYNGRRVAFSTHSNSDVQNTYRVFLDMTGKGLFQEINRGMQWQLPGWAR